MVRRSQFKEQGAVPTSSLCYPQTATHENEEKAVAWRRENPGSWSIVSGVGC